MTAKLESLSRREREVLGLIVAGKKPLEISARLGIGYKTTSTYRTRLMEKLGVKTNAELVTLQYRAQFDRLADHTLIAAALVAGVAHWNPTTVNPHYGAIHVGGALYETSLDDAGVPILTGLIREQLRIALPIRPRAAA